MRVKKNFFFEGARERERAAGKERETETETGVAPCHTVFLVCARACAHIRIHMHAREAHVRREGEKGSGKHQPAVERAKR